MTALSQNPHPPILTGHSPPPLKLAHPPAAQARQPRFGGSFINFPPIALTPNSLSQFWTDTFGVGAPVALAASTRGWINVFESIYLELIEDGAFYFTLPIVGPILGAGLANAFSGVKDWRKNKNLSTLASHLELTDKKGQADARRLVGHPMRKISEELEKLPLDKKAKQEILERVVSTKAGALIGTLGVAAGLEYMIQHTKNVVTAQGFKTKNFAAVAGLEESKAHTEEGLTDPVKKAKKRGKQVGAFVLGSLATAFATPFILKNIGGLRAAEKVMKVADCKPGFDISKPILALLIGTGVASYLDAARDPLEKKETGTRLCVVVPYLLFGKELAGYGITKFKEKFTKVILGQDKSGKEVKVPIRDVLPLTTGDPFKKMVNKESLLEFDVIKSAKEIVNDLSDKDDNNQKVKERLNKLGGFKLTDEIKAKLIAEHGKLNIYSYLLGALGCGLGMNLLIYKQTQARYKHKQEAAKQQQTAGSTPIQKPLLQTVLPVQPAMVAPAAFSGRPQAAAPWPVPVRQPAGWPKPGTTQPFSPFALPVNRFTPQEVQV
jgi:hypothetical protein